MEVVTSFQEHKISFVIKNPVSFGYQLIDSTSDEFVRDLESNSIIRLTDTSNGDWSIRATVSEVVGSVKFQKDSYTRTESVDPYALCSDSKGDFSIVQAFL